MKTSEPNSVVFDPWAKVTHAWDKPETINEIEQYNPDALPDIDDFLAILEDFENNEPDLIDMLVTFQHTSTLFDEGE